VDYKDRRYQNLRQESARTEEEAREISCMSTTIEHIQLAKDIRQFSAVQGLVEFPFADLLRFLIITFKIDLSSAQCFHLQVNVLAKGNFGLCKFQNEGK
jgi:hypothetical protein